MYSRYKCLPETWHELEWRHLIWYHGWKSVSHQNVIHSATNPIALHWIFKTWSLSLSVSLSLSLSLWYDIADSDKWRNIVWWWSKFVLYHLCENQISTDRSRIVRQRLGAIIYSVLSKWLASSTWNNVCQAPYGYLFSIRSLQYFLTLFQTQVTKQIYTIKFKFHFNFISLFIS